MDRPADMASGTTEPRLRDLRRIREIFGGYPLP